MLGLQKCTKYVVVCRQVEWMAPVCQAQEKNAALRAQRVGSDSSMFEVSAFAEKTEKLKLSKSSSDALCSRVKSVA